MANTPWQHANIDHQEEVRKLQNLIRELKVQNLQLRNKQFTDKQILEEPTEESLGYESNERTTNSDVNDVDIGDTVDEVELIDVSSLNLSSEDTWLYEVPKENQKGVSPYQWMISDAEDPQQIAIQANKRSLVIKIESLSLTPSCSRNLQEPSFADESPLLKHVMPINLCDKLNKESFSIVDKHKNFDSRTFTRPKKTVIANLPIVDGENSVSSHNLTASSSPNSDVLDIQTLARLQEECLRQSSSPSTPRRNSAGTGTASRTSSNSTSPSMSPFGSQNLDDPISGKVKPRSLRPNGVTSHVALPASNQQRYGCDVNNVCDKNNGRILRYSVSPAKEGVNSRSSSPAASRLSQSPAYRKSPPLEQGHHTSRAIVSSRIPKPRTRLPVYTRDSWKDGCY